MQYCPAGAPQESPPRSTEDLRKGLHEPILSGMPSTWERMQHVLWPQVSSSWNNCACGYLLSWVHYCDQAITINSLRHHQRHPQREAREGDTSGVFNHHFFQEKRPSGAFLWWQMWEYQRRSRRLLYLGQQTKHLLAGRLENNIKPTEDKFPLTAKCCPEMSHAGTFQSNLLHSHQGTCRQKGFIYIFPCFFYLQKIFRFLWESKTRKLFPLCFCPLNNFFHHLCGIVRRKMSRKSKSGKNRKEL